MQPRMPERSFGRTVRYRRTRIGLSQAQLGELVGRSASSIRSWERDVSTPTDPSVLTALSAILDIDGRALFDKAGVETPAEESHPTVEESLASLALSRIRRPSLVILANMGIAAFASMWISNVAAPVLCFSLAQPILRNLPAGHQFPKALVMGEQPPL